MEAIEREESLSALFLACVEKCIRKRENRWLELNLVFINR